MKEQMILTDFSGIYREQSFCKGEEAAWLDVRELPGTNCYCDAEARASIEKLLQPYSPEGIHFLDSGNYHYMSLLWMEKIKVPFRLLVFDNHTDMQPPAFGGLLSCGGWIAAALEELPLLQNIVLIGPDQAAFDQAEPELKERVNFLSRENLAELSEEEKTDFMEKVTVSDAKLPWYISVDKDVLCPENAVTGWSQGDMRLSELTGMLEMLLKGRRVIGMDVCGEADTSQARSDACNDQANRALLELWKRYGGNHFEK